MMFTLQHSCGEQGAFRPAKATCSLKVKAERVHKRQRDEDDVKFETGSRESRESRVCIALLFFL